MEQFISWTGWWRMYSWKHKTAESAPLNSKFCSCQQDSESAGNSNSEARTQRKRATWADPWARKDFRTRESMSGTRSSLLHLLLWQVCHSSSMFQILGLQTLGKRVTEEEGRKTGKMDIWTICSQQNFFFSLEVTCKRSYS